MGKAQRIGTGQTSVEIKVMDLRKVAHAEYNPREGNADQTEGLANSLDRFGYLQPIVINKRTQRTGWPAKSVPTIVGGHRRHEALTATGETSAPCILVDLDPVQEKAANLELNNPHIQGHWTHELADRLDEVREDLSNDAFLDLRLDQLRAELDAGGADEIERAKAATKKGDVYALGRHVLLCVDPCSDEIMGRLCDVSNPDDVLTMVVKSPAQCDALISTWQGRTGEVARKSDE